ncbi:hypothetical protein Tco_1414424 [Tanacetum coccineum]
MSIPMNIYLKLACTGEKVSPTLLKLKGNDTIERPLRSTTSVMMKPSFFLVTTGRVQVHVFFYPRNSSYNYSNEELKGHCIIFKNETRSGDTLYLRIPPMRINIMFVFTSENISVKVEENDKVKAKIQSKIRVPIDKEQVDSCILQMQWRYSRATIPLLTVK